MILHRFSWDWRILAMVAILFGDFSRVAGYRRFDENSMSEKNKRDWTEFQEYREWKILRKAWERRVGKAEPDSSVSSGGENLEDGELHEKSNFIVEPPPVDQAALMARFIVNQADWTSVATISTRKDIASFPIANVISFSDGPLGNGSGIPYMYLTPLDYTAQDLAADHRATLLMTLAQGDYCKEKQMDPMDPRCARVLLSGKIKKVDPNSNELEVAKKTVFGRHPKLAGMPANHYFFFAKMEMVSIAVLDTFGGPKYVSLDDYLNPPNPKDRQFHGRSNDRLTENVGDGTEDDDSSNWNYALRV